MSIVVDFRVGEWSNSCLEDSASNVKVSVGDAHPIFYLTFKIGGGEPGVLLSKSKATQKGQ